MANTIPTVAARNGSARLTILQIIHGYPMRYNAGSEVYTQTLCHGLAGRHEVHVFTREEDPFGPDYRMRMETDPDDDRVTLHLVNLPRARDGYRHQGVDDRFESLLTSVRPDIVHVGHLNHLSTSLLPLVSARGIPVVYTLHDYWLMCPRGQFMQTHPQEADALWSACTGQEDRKCAERCYAKYFSGSTDERGADVAYWGDWVARRMRHVRDIAEYVDCFIAPSRYLLERYRDEFGIPDRKLRFLDYGFDLDRLSGRSRKPGEPFTFGYIGTHIPAKGIHQLIEAFGGIQGDAGLRIWGRPLGQETTALQALAHRLPEGLGERVQWMGEYRNQRIVPDVFDRVDAIVVPSIWVENSPLVIHEAQQARIPVITADAGGMAELVRHEHNGLLFAHRSPDSLREQMQRFVEGHALAATLGGRGYLASESGDVPSVQTHVEAVEHIYGEVRGRRERLDVRPGDGPWRITFDTNPDTCNLQCVMCEEHSPHSPLQIRRKAEGRPRRVMPIELIERVVADAAPRGLREIIPSTMGEPLLYADFDKILEICRRFDVKLNLTTNGTFPRHGARKWAEQLVPLTSDVKISWNGATSETQEGIMLGSRWSRMLDDVREFIRVRDAHAATGGNRCRVTFQLTFLESNVHELADIVRLALSLGVDRVKGHHLWAHFGQIEGLSMRRDANAVRRWNTAVAEARAVAAETALPNGQTIILENIFPLDPDATEDLAPDGPCPFLGREAWVSAEGRFDPCCAPDAQRRTLGEFGSLHGLGIMDIWDGTAYRGLLATYANRALCMGCNMRRPTEVV